MVFVNWNSRRDCIKNRNAINYSAYKQATEGCKNNNINKQKGRFVRSHGGDTSRKADGYRKHVVSGIIRVFSAIKNNPNELSNYNFPVKASTTQGVAI